MNVEVVDILIFSKNIWGDMKFDASVVWTPHLAVFLTPPHIYFMKTSPILPIPTHFGF